MTTQTELFEFFGIREQGDLVTGKTNENVREQLESVIEDHSWVAFTGLIGSGKTETVFKELNTLKKEEKVKFVEISSINRKGINDITLIDSIILELGGKFDGDAAIPRRKRSQELKIERILAKAKEAGYTIILVIDEAQELHPDTFNIIKRFRDVKLLNTGNTLAVVMIGQPQLVGLIKSNPEVKHRAKVWDFEYTKAEKVKIAEHYSQGLLTTDQCREVAERAIANEHGDVTPLSIKNAIEIAMDNAYRLGKSSLEMYHFEFMGQPKPRKSKERKKIEVVENAAEDVESKINKQAS